MQYNIAKMRVVKPSPKMAEKHPDRFATVFGVFSDDKGHTLSITSKVITFEDAKDPAFSLDITNGILTLADSVRGRKASVSLSQADIEAELAKLREE